MPPGHRGAGPGARRDALSQVTWLDAAVFVGRLPRRTDTKDVAAFFSAIGPVRQVIPSRDTYLFVEYESPELADMAARVLNSQPFNGNRIVVQVSLAAAHSRLLPQTLWAPLAPPAHTVAPFPALRRSILPPCSLPER